MRTLAEIERAVAVRIAELPPEVQGEIVPLIAFAFKAGYIDCQTAYTQAGAALRKGMEPYGVQE